MKPGFILAILVAALPGTARATEDRAGILALGVRAGTLGLGGDLAVPLASWAAARIGGHRLSASGSYTHDAIDYDMRLSFDNAAGWMDFHPGSGSFRLTGGILWLDHLITGLATPTRNVRIGDGVFTPRQVGTLRMAVDSPSCGWYLGFGFGNAFSRSGRWSGSFDLGVVLHASPDFTLTSDGAMSGHPAFQRELNRTRDEIHQDLIRKIRYWPVLSLGLAFRF